VEAALSEAVGGVVKVVIPRVFELPKEFAYDVLVMDRDLGEVGDSQEAMIQRRGFPVLPGERESLEAGYRRWLEEMPRLFAAMPGVRWMRVRHRQLLSDPAAVAAEICSWLGCGMDLQAMVAVVDGGLYRHRRGIGKAEDKP
jgi:hypothetical protein